MTAILTLILAAQVLQAMPQDGSGATVLSTEQRAAASRLLDATGAPARRNAQIDQTLNKLLLFTSTRCAVHAGGDAKLIQACAAKDKAGRLVTAKVAAARPQLLAAIEDIQECAYAARLSVSDMDAVTAFARSPVGTRFFQAIAPAAQEAERASSKLVIDRITAIVDGLQARLPQPDTVVDPDQ